jgi:hypothetical protein
MSEYNWRYDVTADGTIFRGRPYTMSEYDHWNDGEVSSCYVGFYTGNWRDQPQILNDSRWNEHAEDSERLMAAHKAALNYPQPGDRVGSDQSPITRWWGNDPVTRAARRVGLAGVVTVHPWPGDEYVIGYWAKDGATAEELDDARRETRDAVESYMTGDVWRIEVEEYDRTTDEWTQVDDCCDEWIGSQIEAEFESEFGLTEFPAELLIEDRAS